MREFKFRVWNGAEMVHDVTVGRFGAFYVNAGISNDGLDPKDAASLTPFNTKYTDQTRVMQYTGMKDIAGVEIYEGDVVAYDTEEGIAAAEVVWTKDVDPNRDMSPILGPGYVLTNAGHWRDYEEGEDAISLLVIGNIYENPDLR